MHFQFDFRQEKTIAGIQTPFVFKFIDKLIKYECLYRNTIPTILFYYKKIISSLSQIQGTTILFHSIE